MTGSSNCNFGNQPGRWTASAGVLNAQQLIAAPPHWQTFDPQCQLQPFLQPILKAGRAVLKASGDGDCSGGISAAPVRLLLLGDSVDRTVARDLCHTAAGLATNQRTEDGQACMKVWLPDDGWVCRLPGITVATQAFWGVSPAGPYSRNRTGNASSRVRQALHRYPAAFGGSPDMVVVGVLLWDLARWKLLSAPVVMASDQLPEALVKEWCTNAGSLLRQIQAAVPDTTTVAVHTLHFPLRNASPHAAGALNHPTITRHAHVAQLNAAMRQLAAAHGLQVIDLQMMTSHFYDASQYLVDNTHPAPWLSRALLNVCLNMVHELHSAGAASVPAKR